MPIFFKINDAVGIYVVHTNLRDAEEHDAKQKLKIQENLKNQTNLYISSLYYLII